MSASSELRSRIKVTWPLRDKSAIDRALTAAEALRRKRSTVAEDANLSATGREKALKEFVVGEIGPILAKVRCSLEWSRRKVAAERESSLSAITKSDSAFGAEIRAYLRGKSQGEVVALLTGEGADRHAQEAVLAAPAFLSEVSQEVMELTKGAYLAAVQPETVTSLSEAEEGIVGTQAAVEILSGEVMAVTGVQPHAFDQWMETTFPFNDEQRNAEWAYLDRCDITDRQQRAA